MFLFDAVYALAAGAIEGLGLGMNTTALLCTRAIPEMNRLARALGSTEVGGVVLTTGYQILRMWTLSRLH
jgi:glycerol-3-phosphate dehydrogenase